MASFEYSTSLLLQPLAPYRTGQFYSPDGPIFVKGSFGLQENGRISRRNPHVFGRRLLPYYFGGNAGDAPNVTAFLGLPPACVLRFAAS